MAKYNDITCSQPQWPWWRCILTGLNAIALILSCVLSWHYFQGGSMVGCGGSDGSGCDHVLNSQWSMLAGVLPVSGLAVGVYLTILVAGFFIGQVTEIQIRRLAWKAMLGLAGSVAGSAIWFTILQKWVIGSFCPYCMATHITGLLLAAFIIWRAMKESDQVIPRKQLANSGNPNNQSPAPSQRIIRPLTAAGSVLAGLALTGIMVAFQVFFTPKVVYHGGESQAKLPAFDYKDVPLVGSPDAPYIVTLLFDYQCSHCQKIHFMMDEAVRRYNGKLAFAICPAPLNSQCNPYIPQDNETFKNSCGLAKISLAVWLANREIFPEFENWMFTFESGDRWQPRSLEAALAKAEELAGKEKIEAALADPWIGQYLQTSTKIYGQTIQNGKGGIPKLIYWPRWVYPEPYNAEDLITILQNSLGVPVP